MSTFQSEYETSTNAIDSIVSTQLSSVSNWLNVPGSLVKASSSSGFIWGFNAGNSVYTCSLPCTGNWKSVDLSAYNLNSVLDLTTDDSNVYILFTANSETQLLVSDAASQGVKTVITVPFPATSIFSTHTYIWAQNAINHKVKCAKPCSMPNWQASSESSVKITSATDSTIYGVDASGNAMQTDENISSWQPINDVNGSIYGKGSDGTLYGIDAKQSAFSFKDKMTSLYTGGLDPTYLSVDSNSNSLWMTTATPGNSGNIFTRAEKPDYSTLMNSINPLDRRRDKIADELETKYARQTDVMIVNKQVTDIIAFFKKIFNIDSNTAKKAAAQSGSLQNNIRDTQKKLDEFNDVQPVLVGLIITLCAVVLLYFLSYSFLGNTTHMFAILTIGIGLLLTANFSSSYK
jgi:hypothetical protein